MLRIVVGYTNSIESMSLAKQIVYHITILQKNIVDVQVMRRGNDLLRSLDLVKNFKSYEYDKLRGELMWQKMRFERVCLFICKYRFIPLLMRC